MRRRLKKTLTYGEAYEIVKKQREEERLKNTIPESQTCDKDTKCDINAQLDNPMLKERK